MVHSIVLQTMKPDRFILWLPNRCEKQPGVEYVLPDWLKGFPTLEVRRGTRDWGSATKLIPTLEEESHPDTRIITFDDDVAYERHAIEELVNGAKRWPRRALCFMGCIDGVHVHSEKILGLRMDVAVMGGFRGVLYKRSFFDDEIFVEMAELLKDGPFLADDQLFSWHLMRRGIKRSVVATKYRGDDPDRLNCRFAEFTDGIYCGPNGELAQQSIERLKALYDRNGWKRSQ